MGVSLFNARENKSLAAAVPPSPLTPRPRPRSREGEEEEEASYKGSEDVERQERRFARDLYVGAREIASALSSAGAGGGGAYTYGEYGGSASSLC